MIDYNLLRKRCQMKVKTFAKLPGAQVTHTQTGQLIYVDRGSPILAVAHLDTVQSCKPFDVYHDKEFGHVVFSPQLDDRLGAYLLIDLLPKMGLTFDLLLTEGEETGQSTAQWFEPAKQYNWMFSFDRRGDDVVMYDYETDDLYCLLQSHNFKVGIGSFSDICFLDHLEIAGFNFGCGYQNEHSKNAYAIIDDTMSQVKKFVAFYNEQKDQRFEYKPIDWSVMDWRNERYSKESDPYWSSKYWSSLEDDEVIDWSDLDECDFCGYEYLPQSLTYINDSIVCNRCLPYVK